jgi:hypothetical protein
VSTTTATVEQSGVPEPPAPDRARAQVRAAIGAGQVAYGLLRLCRSRSGWYHVALGVRQLVQARLDAAGAFSPAADAAVDGLHVATMLGLALLRRGHRRSALLGAAHAAAWALLDAALARADPPEILPGTAGRTPAPSPR